MATVWAQWRGGWQKESVCGMTTVKKCSVNVRGVINGVWKWPGVIINDVISQLSAVSRRQRDDDAAVALHSSKQKGEGSVSLHSFDV